MSRDPDGFPFNPDPLHPDGDWLDERIPSWEDQRRLAIEPRRFDVMGCLGCAVVLLIALACALLVLAGVSLLVGAWHVFGLVVS